MQRPMCLLFAVFLGAFGGGVTRCWNRDAVRLSHHLANRVRLRDDRLVSGDDLPLPPWLLRLFLRAFGAFGGTACAAADVFSSFSVSLGRLEEQRVQRPMCFPLRLVPWSGCSEEERYVLLGECSGSVSRAALRAEHVCESIAVSVVSDGHSGCVATRIGSLFPEFFPDLPGLWRIGILLCIALTFLLVRWCCACLLVCLRRPTQDALSVYCLFVCLCLVLRALLVKLQVSVTRSFYALLRLCPFVVARN